jgi:serine/threonine-protein kinase
LAAIPERSESEPPPVHPGMAIGRFEILREVGRGGFGVVYEARDRELGRHVALKVVRHGRAAAQEDEVRREAEAIARLAHPNLVTLHDVGWSEVGAYLVLEFLSGTTLQERLERGPLPVEEAVHIATEVARGLAHAHAEGVVHRDLKPSNVFLTNGGLVKILDFGLAHAFGRRRVGGGTPAYMAPEQWEDDPEDERTDVFALGVLLYRMLSGEYPFREGQGRWSSEAARAPPDLDLPGAPGLAGLVHRMLEKAPRSRPRDGAAVLAALTAVEDALRARSAADGPPVHASRHAMAFGSRWASFPRGRRAWLLVALGVAAALPGAAWYAWRRASGQRPAGVTAGAVASVAVLPFQDLSSNHDQEYFSDGMAEEIASALSRVKGLRVPGRASSSYFKGKNARPQEVARELKVEHLLEGSVRRSGSRLRISAELVKAGDGERVWSQSFDRELTDVIAVQEEIARAVVEALRVKLLPGQAPPRRELRAASPEAYQSYLQGLHFRQSQSEDSTRRALAAFEKAVDRDPAYAPAWAGLAGARIGAGSNGVIPYPAARRGAIAAAERAVALAPDLPEALAARARARTGEWDWAGAKADIVRALELDPNGAAAEMRRYLLYTGRLPEAIAWAERVVELEPLSGDAWNNMGIAYWLAGRPAEAVRAYTRALAVDPGNVFADINRGDALIDTGRPAEALAPCLRGVPPDPPQACAVRAYHALGQTAKAKEALAAMRANGAEGFGLYSIALAYGCLGDDDEALAWLERARAEHVRDLPLAVTEPCFRNLRTGPRWAAFLRGINFPAEVGGAQP